MTRVTPTGSPVQDPASSALGRLVDELTERVLAGEAVDLELLLDDHSEYGEALRHLVPALELLADLGHADRPGLPPGEVLGSYRLIRQVGRGGMGVVYEAEEAGGRRVALKVLPECAALDPRRLARFRVEALASAVLDHPHVVPVYAIGCERGVHFYAMRFVDGRSLADAVKQTGRIAAAEAAGLALQAAGAMEHAHRLGVVHRDLKPANFLVEPDGHLWVVDFGVAQVHGQAELTRTGDLLGTLRVHEPRAGARPSRGRLPERRVLPGRDPL